MIRVNDAMVGPLYLLVRWEVYKINVTPTFYSCPTLPTCSGLTIASYTLYLWTWITCEIFCLRRSLPCDTAQNQRTPSNIVRQVQKENLHLKNAIRNTYKARVLKKFKLKNVISIDGQGMNHEGTKYGLQC